MAGIPAAPRPSTQGSKEKPREGSAQGKGPLTSRARRPGSCFQLWGPGGGQRGPAGPRAYVQLCDARVCACVRILEEEQGGQVRSWDPGLSHEGHRAQDPSAWWRVA